MEQQGEHNSDLRGGYQVPEGYFENLTATVVSRAQQTADPAPRGSSLRSLLGFAAGFAAMVLLAVVITRTVTPKTTNEPTDQTALTTEAALIEMYDVSEDDILEYYLYPADTLSGSSQMAQAIDEYLEAYPTETPVYY